MRMNNRMLTGKEGKTIIQLSLPMMLGLVSVVSLNLIDTYFIKLLGAGSTDSIAYAARVILLQEAMGYTFPVILLQGAISGGLGVGAAAVISRAFGSGNKQAVRRIASDSLLISILIVIIFVIAGELSIRPLFSSMGADKESLPLISSYMRIWYLGLPFVVIPMIGNSIIRASGNTKIPALAMVLSMLINTILDPIFIDKMGIAGAAAATVIARACTMIISTTYLIFKLKLIDFRFPKIRQLMQNWKNILKIGLPAAFSRVFLPITMGFIMKIIKEYGREAVAGINIGMKIEMFALVPMMAVSTVLIPFIGQNMGARKPDRVKNALSFSIKLAVFYGLGLFALFALTGTLFGKIFNSDPVVYKLIHQYLFITSTGYALLSCVEFAAAAYNALHKPMIAAAIHFFRVICLYLPLALIGSELFDITGIISGIAAASVISGIAALISIRKILKTKISL